MDTHTPWHRLLGMALTDLFTGRPWRVELETELALKSQRLDLLIIERGSSGAAPGNADILDNDWPDGLDNLAAHNLMTYKSHQESLDAWALEELTGHYVTYRKLRSIQAAQTQRVRRRVARLEERQPYDVFPVTACCRLSSLRRGDPPATATVSPTPTRNPARYRLAWCL